MYVPRDPVDPVRMTVAASGSESDGFGARLGRPCVYLETRRAIFYDRDSWTMPPSPVRVL